MIKIFITILGLLLSNCTNAQTTTKEITDKFFVLYAKDPLEAVDYAFSTNKYWEKNPDGIRDLKNKLKNEIDICGEYLGFEMLSSKTAGKNIMMTSFILKYDRLPIRFIFFFYKPKDTWRVNSLLFDENIDDDLKEGIKAYRLKENMD